MKWINLLPNKMSGRSYNNKIIFKPNNKKLLFAFGLPIKGVEKSRGGVILFEGVEYIRQAHFLQMKEKKDILNQVGLGILYQNTNSSLIKTLRLNNSYKLKHYLTFTYQQASLEIIARSHKLVEDNFSMR